MRIESIFGCGQSNAAAAEVVRIDANDRTFEDITFLRQPDGVVILTPTYNGSAKVDLGKLTERNDVDPYFDLSDVVDRISLVEYRKRDGKNVKDLGLDLVPAISLA